MKTDNVSPRHHYILVWTSKELLVSVLFQKKSWLISNLKFSEIKPLLTLSSCREVENNTATTCDAVNSKCKAVILLVCSMDCL